MTTWTVPRAASVLLDAADSRRAVAPLTGEWPGIDLPIAYAVQDETLRQRLDRGERLIGVKVGLTGLSGSPVTAWLTDAMVPPAGAAVPRDRLIRPRAEPEIVFVMGTRLAGPGVTAATALAAVSGVASGVEVTDSRYSDDPVTVPDLVADNASTGYVVIGPVAVPPAGIDLALEACLVEMDGAVVDSATGAAVQGHPASALARAANDLGRRGLAIEPGWLVLTGAMTDPIPCPPGVTVAAHFTHLASVFLPAG
jgi:2-oxo-3-hexenedioate decarboxylase